MEKKVSLPCYVQVVYDLISGIHPRVENYPEFADRGHDSHEADAWIRYAKMATYLHRSINAHPNVVKEYAKCMANYVWMPNSKNYHKFEAIAHKAGIENPLRNISDIEVNAGMMKIPNYRLFESEVDTILAAEEYGRGPRGVILDYCDGSNFGNKQVISVDYRKIEANRGGRQDVILVYSGHQLTGHRATELIYRYLKNNGKLPEHIFNIGFEDNQNMTDFSPEYQYRKRSEADTYTNEEIALGLPEEYVRKLWLDPNDTDTWQNIKVVASLKERFGIEECNLIIIGYPVYQLRTATEFAWGLGHAENAPDCHITIADIEPQKYMEERILSYDQPLYQLGDLSLMNCCAHIHLRHNDARYPLPNLAEYPESFKRLGAMFMAYSYPNVYSAMLGSEGKEKERDEEVASIMKILRYLILCEYDKGMSGKAMDEQEAEYIKKYAEMFEAEGLTIQ